MVHAELNALGQKTVCQYLANWKTVKTIELQALNGLKMKLISLQAWKGRSLILRHMIS